ncbi:MAG TPA: hypothetical protein VHE13_11085 [Opitutus sp.]|nr:hypothetical protein [Opitutus sp.]
MPLDRTTVRRAAVAAGCVLFVVAAMRGTLRAEAKPAATTTVIARLAGEVGELEKQAAELSAAADHAGATALLDRALEKQTTLIRLEASPGVDERSRLDRLTVARDDERAQWAAVRIDALADAAEAARPEQPDVALQKNREALRLQREVDDSRARERFKNYAREMSLAQAVQNAEAEPLAKELEAALGAARAAVASQRWADATAAYATARGRRMQLGRNYARSRFASAAALADIDAEIAAFAPAFAAAEIGGREEQAEAATKAGRVPEAAALYAGARDAQIKLNADFAGSRFASPQRVEQLEVARQTLLGGESLAQARALDASAVAHLFRRETLAAGRDMAQAAALLAAVEKNFPLARGFDGALKIKLAYLVERSGELGALQDAVYERLVPVPGSKDLLMLRMPVPRAIHGRVMSAGAGAAGESSLLEATSWNEAREFCRRLSWALGARVRLPTREEYLAAEAGGVIAADAGLREWLAADRSDDPAPLVTREAPGELRGGTELDRGRRERGVSFRFVVEYPLE